MTGFGAALPRSPKSNNLLGRPNRLLLLGDLGKPAPNSIVYRRLRSETGPMLSPSNNGKVTYLSIPILPIAQRLI